MKNWQNFQFFFQKTGAPPLEKVLRTPLKVEKGVLPPLHHSNQVCSVFLNNKPGIFFILVLFHYKS